MTVPSDLADSAFIDPSAELGEGAIVHPFAYVGANVKIGARTVIGPGAVIMDGSQIGEDCVIAGEVVVGSRGFGFVFDGRQHLRIPQVGIVKIGDRTTVGPGTCIDRSTMEVTTIGNDCQIGSLCQIAHNCQIGDECELGGACGLSGTTKLARRVVFGERVGTQGHSTYGEGAIVEDWTGITRTRIPAGSRWAGYPGRMVKE